MYYIFSIFNTKYKPHFMEKNQAVRDEMYPNYEIIIHKYDLNALIKI